MLQPKRVKYRRPHGLSYEGKSKAGNEVSFGEFGLQALEGEYITARQIEAARMGSGKGSPDQWVAVVKACRCMFEIGGVPEATAREALRLAAYKLPIHTKIIKKGE